jgi:integrative and conjugative element protein (TIGR02256 family)
MNIMIELFLCSKDRKFGVSIRSDKLTQILEFCKLSLTKETGGILVGRYVLNQSCADIKDVIGPTEDSRSGGTWFYRGVRGLQKCLNDLWKVQHYYYLGEWHFHPNAAASPSDIDINQMVNISKSAGYSCPEPLLIVIGGNPASQWNLRAFVFYDNSNYVELDRE